MSPRKRKYFQKYFRILLREIGTIDSCKKPDIKNPHATVPLSVAGGSRRGKNMSGIKFFKNLQISLMGLKYTLNFNI